MDVCHLGPGLGRQPPRLVRAVGTDRAPDRSQAPEDDLLAGEQLDEVQRSALHLERRRAVFELVARTPGLNKRQVGQRLGIPRSSAAHHLERLEAYDLVVLLDGDREGEVLCFHPEHVHLWKDERTRVLYGQAPVRYVAIYVHENPGTTTQDLAEALERAPRTIRDHLTVLLDRGLVERHRFHRRVEYHPTEVLEAWADDVGGCYRRPWTDEA